MRGNTGELTEDTRGVKVQHVLYFSPSRFDFRWILSSRPWHMSRLTFRAVRPSRISIAHLTVWQELVPCPEARPRRALSSQFRPAGCINDSVSDVTPSHFSFNKEFRTGCSNRILSESAAGIFLPSALAGRSTDAWSPSFLCKVTKRVQRAM